MIEFVFKGDKGRLTKVISAQYPSLSYNHIRSLLRGKDIMVDGKRVKEDMEITSGSTIRLYTDIKTPDEYEYKVTTVYEDDNLFVFFKPKGLETEGDISLLSYAKKLCSTAVAVHRLDVNTDGVIIVAKHEKAGDLLKKAIKDKDIKKYYLSAVYGETKPSDRLVAYLVKDSEKSTVKIYDKEIKGGLKIVTEYKRLFTDGKMSIVEVNLLTGRTHQIRAHMAHIGHPVLGDGKYGKRDINKAFPYKKQALTAYKLLFETKGELSYLNGKVIMVDTDLSVYL